MFVFVCVCICICVFSLRWTDKTENKRSDRSKLRHIDADTIYYPAYVATIWRILGAKLEYLQRIDIVCVCVCVYVFRFTELGYVDLTFNIPTRYQI